MKPPSAPPCPLCGSPTVPSGKRVVNPLTRVFDRETDRPDETIFRYRCQCGVEFTLAVQAPRPKPGG